MRIAITAAFFVLFVPLPALSQYAMIGVFDDPAGIRCGIADNERAVIPIYVVAHSYSGITGTPVHGSRSDLFTRSFLDIGTPVFPVTLGSSQTGVAIGFGSCRTDWIHVLRPRTKFKV